MLTERGIAEGAQQARGLNRANIDRIDNGGAIAEAINKAQSIANLLSSTNQMADNAVERLYGPRPNQSGGQSAAEAMYPGQIGELMEALDRVFALASINSDLAGQFNRI